MINMQHGDYSEEFRRLVEKELEESFETKRRCRGQFWVVNYMRDLRGCIHKTILSTVDKTHHYMLKTRLVRSYEYTP